MKYLKMLGLAAIAAGALMAFVGAGTASATTLTCPTGTACPAGTTIHAESVGKAVLDAPFGNIECNSTVEGHTTTEKEQEERKEEVVKAGKADGPITALNWSNCGSDNVVTLASGSLSVTNISGTKNGTLSSTGAEVTVEHVGTHCIFKTNATDIGTLTGSTATGGTPKLDISATIPRVGGRSGVFCGSSAPWTGSYSIDAPMTGDVDA